MEASSFNPRQSLQRPRSIVEQDKGEYVVVLIKPTGSRSFYVSTGVDSDGTVYPFVSESVERAKHFALENNARKVSGDMGAFLNREYRNYVKWS